MTLSLSLTTFCRPNSSFAFDFLQHHVHIRPVAYAENFHEGGFKVPKFFFALKSKV